MGSKKAMLRKQASRLMTSPNNLTSRLLKAKYYPRIDFLGAHPGHNPISPGGAFGTQKASIKEGYKWNIGAGDKVKLW